MGSRILVGVFSLLCLVGCSPSKYQVLQTIADRYKSVAIVQMEMDTAFSYVNPDGTVIPKYPSKPGEAAFSDEDKQFLADSAKQIAQTFMQVTKTKITLADTRSIDTLFSKEALPVNGKLVFLGSENGLTPDEAKVLCKKNGVDAVVSISLGYAYANSEKSTIENASNLFNNLVKIATLRMGTSANSIALLVSLKVYDRFGNCVLERKNERVLSKSGEDFVLGGHIFHRYPEIGDRFESALTNFMAIIQEVGKG